MASENQDHSARIAAAVGAPIPHLTANSIAVGLGTGDVVIVMELNGQPVATVNLSFTMTKSMATILGNVIADLEDISGRPIMTTKEVEKWLELRAQKNGQSSAAASGTAKSRTKAKQHAAKE